MGGMDNIGIRPEANPRRWAVLGVLCLSLLLIVVDNTIVNVALPTFVRDLHATTSQLQWIVDAYTLFFACLLLTAGALGDRRGRKGMLTLGLVVFGAGRIGDALAGQPISPAALKVAKDSLGGALAVAQQAGERGSALVAVARKAFTEGLRIDTLITSGVAVLSMIVASVFLPSRAEAAVVEVDELEQELVSSRF